MEGIWAWEPLLWVVRLTLLLLIPAGSVAVLVLLWRFVRGTYRLKGGKLGPVEFELVEEIGNEQLDALAEQARLLTQMIVEVGEKTAELEGKLHALEKGHGNHGHEGE